MLAAALTAGICSVGGNALHVGVIPTPAMAYLVRLYEADAAVMISASHNPMEYNGIKWFDGKGFKLSDALEDRMEALIRSGEALPHPEGRDVGTVIDVPRARQDYCDYLVGKSAGRFEGMKVVLDCANGATSAIGREVFERLGANVIATFCWPDGMNINDECGSTHPERLQQLVVANGAADRLISCDEHGNIVDGNQAMGILALSMQKKGTLKNDTLVITVMSNLGLKKRMQQAGIHVAETKVGDRYVLETMLEHGHSIGGEQSGHIILLDHNTTGDGMMSAIALLNAVAESGKRLSQLADDIPLWQDWRGAAAPQGGGGGGAGRQRPRARARVRHRAAHPHHARGAAAGRDIGAGAVACAHPREQLRRQDQVLTRRRLEIWERGATHAVVQREIRSGARAAGRGLSGRQAGARILVAV